MRPWRAACPTSTSTTEAPPARISAFVNFCLPIEPSMGVTTLRSYALKAQPKSEMSTRVNRRSIPLMRRDGSVRPQESSRDVAAPACDVIARSDGLDELGDVLRLVLEVAVHRHDHLAARAHETACIAGC